jgi:glycosyltransferase 2 family protein
MSKKLVNYLKWFWIVAVLGGAGWYFYTHFQEISGYLGTLSISRILLSTFLFLVGKFLLSDITRLSLKKVGKNISYSEAFSITSVTQLGKYLPGGIWHFAGKFGIYKVMGISTKRTTQAMIYENVWLLSSATIVGILTLLVSSREVFCEYLPFICNPTIDKFLKVGMPILWIAGMVLFEKLFFRYVKVDVSDFLLVLVEQLATWILFGISYWLVFPTQSGFLLQIIGAFSLSWVAGYVALFAPGGIGIREFLLAVILGGFFASREVATYATVHRLIWVFIEIILGALSAALIGLPNGVEASPPEIH